MPTDAYDREELAHLRHIVSKMDTMRINSVLTDISLVCGGKEFEAHRNVIAAACPFFETAFAKGWTASSSIKLSNISAVSMEAILSFIYSHKLTEIIGDQEAMKKLLEDAAYLQMDDLVKFAYRMFSELYLKTNNFYNSFQFFENLNSEHCLSEITAFLAKNFCEIANSQDFLHLTSSQLENLLSHRNVDKSSMEQVFTSVLKWIESKDEREEVVIHLLEIFETWCSECLKEVVQKNVSPKWSYKTVDLLSSFSARNAQVNNEDAATAVPEETIACIKENKDTHCYLMARFNVDDYTWQVSKELPFKVQHGSSIIAYKHHIFLFGGQPLWPEHHTVSSRVVKFCPLTHRVLSLDATLVTPVASAGIGILKGSLYIVNGINDDGRCLALVQRYNPTEGTCQPAPSTNRGHCCPLVCGVNDSLIIVSSSKDDGNIIERYDLISDQWSDISLIPGPFYGCNAVSCDSKIFVLKYNEFNQAGDQYESKFHIYDVCSETWDVKEFEAGPRKAWDMVCAKVHRNPTIFTVESDGCWQKYNTRSSEWENPALSIDDAKWFVVNTFIA